MDVMIFPKLAFALVILLLVVVPAYVSYQNKRAPESKRRHEPGAYGCSIAGAAVVGYVIGIPVGIAVACSSPGCGNLCGLFGIFFFGPLFAMAAATVSPLVLWMITKRTPKTDRQNNVETNEPNRWRTLAANKRLRVIAGIAMALFTLALISFGALSSALPPPINDAERNCINSTHFSITVGVANYRYPVYSKRLVGALRATSLFDGVELLETAPKADVIARESPRQWNPNLSPGQPVDIRNRAFDGR